MRIRIKDETAPLKGVIVGRADSSGPIPSLEEAYDPKSAFHIKKGDYPKESELIKEMQGLVDALEKHNVQVLRPSLIQNCNQIFARDIAFVIENYLFLSNILPARAEELRAIKHHFSDLPQDKIIELPEEVHIEGGDIMPCNDHIFIGYYAQDDYKNYITARTNQAAVDFFTKFFPNKAVKAFELKKSNTDPALNALHLDCCFQPVGKDKCIIYPDGFLNWSDADELIEYFGKENTFIVTQQEMVDMNCNIFSINPKLVITDSFFDRLNTWLAANDIQTEKINYRETSKQGGLLRCSTMPYLRDYEN